MELDELKKLLQTYRRAESEILIKGQSYAFQSGGSSRTLSRADLKLIQEQIRTLSNQIDLQSGCLSSSFKII